MALALDSATLDIVSQVFITILGVGAILLVDRRNKWGFVLGLVSQPFWLVTSIIHDQWGVFLVTFAYIVGWGYGVYLWFFDKEMKAAQEPRTRRRKRR